MSNISIAVGQCGLQIFDSTMSAMHKGPDYDDLTTTTTNSSSHSSYSTTPSSAPVGTARRALFHENSGRARAVFVDSEPRVITSLQADLRKPWVSSQGVSVVHENSGRGNNWAQGHYNSESLVKQTLECVRKEVEACDWYRGASLFHALGGGTGSGAGTKILRRVRDEYPKCGVVSVCVAPSSSTESPVYGYNTLLSLWQLQQHADAIVLFNNDDLHRRAHRAVVGNQESQQVMTDQVNVPIVDLNTQCALSVAGMLYPTTSPSSGRWSPFRSTTLHDVVSDVAPVYDLKYLDVRTSKWSLPSERERQRRRRQTRSAESWARYFYFFIFAFFLTFCDVQYCIFFLDFTRIPTCNVWQSKLTTFFFFFFLYSFQITSELQSFF